MEFKNAKAETKWLEWTRKNDSYDGVQLREYIFRWTSALERAIGEGEVTPEAAALLSEAPEVVGKLSVEQARKYRERAVIFLKDIWYHGPWLHALLSPPQFPWF